jgi:hypothetical protein
MGVHISPSPLDIFVASLIMIVQFSPVVVPVLVEMLSWGMNLYQITALWMASHTAAIALAYFSTRLIRNRSERISAYLEKRINEAELYVGSLGLFVGLVIFNFAVWIYIATPIMVLMKIDWKKIFATSIIGHLFYYALMIGTIFWLYTVSTNLLLIVTVTLVIAFAVSIVTYQVLKRFNGKKKVPKAEKVQV